MYQNFYDNASDRQEMWNNLEASGVVWSFRGHGGMADATDLKSVDRKVVWVQVPLPPYISGFLDYRCPKFAVNPGLIQIKSPAQIANAIAALNDFGIGRQIPRGRF